MGEFFSQKVKRSHAERRRAEEHDQACRAEVSHDRVNPDPRRMAHPQHPKSHKHTLLELGDIYTVRGSVLNAPEWSVTQNTKKTLFPLKFTHYSTKRAASLLYAL